MTGVLPIVKYSSGSELNMFIEYNFINDNLFDQYFGFTEKEVEALCMEQHLISFEQMKEWYDGYVTMNGHHLLNPRSVVNALMSGLCQNYWTETGPFDEIAQCIRRNVDAVRDDIISMIGGDGVSVSLDAYTVSQKQYHTREGILSAMCVFGFLTYYQGTVRIPNRELLDKFYITLKMPEMGAIGEIIARSEELLQATLNQNEEIVAQNLEEIHDENISILSYHNENSLACVIVLAYQAAHNRYYIKREEPAGKGFADFIFYPKYNDPAMIMELKYGHSAEKAIAQIEEKKYTSRIKQGDCLLVGINYDRKTKKHECKIKYFKK